MNYAIVEEGGKQYKVTPGQTIRVEKLGLPVGEEVSLGRVLLMAGEEGIKVGTPYLAGASVRAKVTGQGRTGKILALKYKSRVRYRRKFGHRQAYSELTIREIVAG